MMNKILSNFFSWGYLSGIPTGAWYSKYLLFFVIAIIILPIIFKIFIKIKGRSEAYEKFDRQWLWGYLSLALVGLFIWFSVTQQLPFFGTRLVVFIWILTLPFYALYLLVYYRRVTLKAVEKYHEKKRKDKYLKR